LTEKTRQKEGGTAPPHSTLPGRKRPDFSCQVRPDKNFQDEMEEEGKKK
jgi:hypothetical protein